MHHYSPETLIKSYSLGVFPMAESHDDDRIFFIDPDQRGVIPLDPPMVNRSMRKLIRKSPYKVTINKAFADVIDGCREITDTRTESWINDPIRQLYCALHRLGFAHSLEVWDKDHHSADHSPKLVGGLYGVACAGAFFGESMFSRVSNASKLALLHLIARLRHGGFVLLDTQFINPHLIQFGCHEVSRAIFRKQLQYALTVKAHLPMDDDPAPMLDQLLHDSTVMS
ncbi:MAG: leucyl/phenylalanyl-tRNA--protein transferase [Candidatus Puniceispirillales bacterium]|nr:leucyl/phenylalanyl-tRNA--protein transferase [Pseudomonadota bacterium]